MNQRKQRPRPAGRAARAEQGFTLIEVLIAVLILSFALLGMAGLQAAALQANREAKLQSVAIGLARELAEMMRGNKDVALTTAGTNPYVGDFTTRPLQPATTSNCLRPGQSCTSGGTALERQREIAAAQMTDWLDRVDRSLPGARVTVCFDSAPYDADGAARWACAAGAGGLPAIKIGWTRGATDRSRTNSKPLEFASAAGSRPILVLPVAAGSTE